MQGVGASSQLMHTVCLAHMLEQCLTTGHLGSVQASDLLSALEVLKLVMHLAQEVFLPSCQAACSQKVLQP